MKNVNEHNGFLWIPLLFGHSDVIDGLQAFILKNIFILILLYTQSLGAWFIKGTRHF